MLAPIGPSQLFLPAGPSAQPCAAVPGSSLVSPGLSQLGAAGAASAPTVAPHLQSALSSIQPAAGALQPALAGPTQAPKQCF